MTDSARRPVLTIYENARLNRELAHLTSELELKVKTQTLELLRRSRASGGEREITGERPNGADEPVGGLRQGRR